MRRLRAIDLYAGIGGWSLGLRLAGIDVVASYERWSTANDTNFRNNAHPTIKADIRELRLEELPDQIDLVVGSPPCTQFSFSNRGGSGDIDDGLIDVAKFLQVVQHLRPTGWAMENVPRLSGLIQKELRPGGRLAEFADLGPQFAVFDMANFGLPQRRKRCLIGNIDFGLLNSYAGLRGKRSLGDVVQALSESHVRDPLYDLSLAQESLLHHAKEPGLSSEELRINEAAKKTHPVYNQMPFPDAMDRPVRTITATCTRVSRESVIIEDPLSSGLFRRLTVRERACLQGFPITYELHAKRYAEQIRMIGNAMPPPFAFLTAQAFKATRPESLPPLGTWRPVPSPPPQLAEVNLDREGRKYPATRSFRFAIPSLRLKSGVRYELANTVKGRDVSWEVRFVYGTSKVIRAIHLTDSLLDDLLELVPRQYLVRVVVAAAAVKSSLTSLDLANAQLAWSRRGPGRSSPFDILDVLDEHGMTLAQIFAESPDGCECALAQLLCPFSSESAGRLGFPKLLRNAAMICAGIVVGAAANDVFAARQDRRLEPGGRAKRDGDERLVG